MTGAAFVRGNFIFSAAAPTDGKVSADKALIAQVLF